MRAVTKRPATTKLAGVLAALALCCSPIAAQAAPTAQTQAQPRASATARSGPTQVAARPCEAKIAGLVGPDLRMADVVAVGSPPKLTLRRYEHPIQRFDGADRSRGVRAMGTTASWWDDSPGAGDAVGADAWSALTLQGTSLVAVRWRQDRLPLGHELLDRYGPRPEPVDLLLGVARFRMLCRAAGIAEVITAGTAIRFSPVDLPDSRQLRLTRLYPGSKVAKAARQVLVPRPMTRPIGGQPVADAALLQWATAVVRDVLAP